MKEIVQGILGYLPKYIPDFLRVFSSPKSAILERNQGRPDDLRDGLIFYTISFFLIFPFQRSLMPNQLELWEHIAQSITLALFLGLTTSALIRLAWQIVKGRAPLVRFLVVYCYSSGVSLIIFTFSALIALGAVKTFYPDSYEPLATVLFSADISPYNSEASEELISLPGSWLYSIVSSVLLCLSVVWTVIAWGTYRRLTGLTKLRSACAFILSLIFIFPVGVAAIFIQRLFM